MGLSAACSQKGRAGLRDDTGIDTMSTLLQVSCQPAHASTQRGAEATVGALLQIVGKGSDQQIATEAQRWPRTMPFAPSQPQLLCRSIAQIGDLGFDIPHTRLSCVLAAPTGNGRRPARVPASRRIIDWRQAELDQRSREARLRLQQLERLLVSRARAGRLSLVHFRQWRWPHPRSSRTYSK